MEQPIIEKIKLLKRACQYFAGARVLKDRKHLEYMLKELENRIDNLKNELRRHLATHKAEDANKQKRGSPRPLFRKAINTEVVRWH